MPNRTETTIGHLILKNPIIAGSGEATMTEGGIRAALEKGAGAVISKSTNESPAAKQQLNHTDYMLFDSRWRPIKWTANPPEDAQLFCRSGLVQEEFDPWLEKLSALDREAATMDSYVIGSLILADTERCVQMAIRMQEAGLRAITVLVAAVHGDQASRGAIAMVQSVDGVYDVVKSLKSRVNIPIWIKLPGQTEDVSLLAKAAMDAGADAVSFIDRTMAMVPNLETRAPYLGTLAAIGGSWSLAVTCRWLARTRQQLGPEFSLIGTNGARDGHDVARMLLSGASGVEMTTSVMLRGTDVIHQSIEQLDSYLASQDVKVCDIIGEATDKLTAYTDQASRPGHWQNFVQPEAV